MNKQIVISNAVIAFVSQNGCCKCLLTCLSRNISCQHIISCIDTGITDLYSLGSFNRCLRPDVHHSQRTLQGQLNRSTCPDVFLHSTESIFSSCIQSPLGCIHRHILQIGGGVEFIIYIIQFHIIHPTTYVISPSQKSIGFVRHQFQFKSRRCLAETY